MNNKKKSSTITQRAIVENINKIIKVNKIYKCKGYKMFLNDNSIEIIYNNSTYTVTATQINNDLYWHLEPYNNSYFETKIDNNINSFDIVIAAINDNETIHK